jgi:hypothetical protein
MLRVGQPMDVPLCSLAVRARRSASRRITCYFSTNSDVDRPRHSSTPTGVLQERNIRNASEWNHGDKKVTLLRPDDDNNKCPDCKGSGKCRWCKGLGKRRDHTHLRAIGCTFCKGSGGCSRCNEFKNNVKVNNPRSANTSLRQQ